MPREAPVTNTTLSFTPTAWAAAPSSAIACLLPHRSGPGP